MEAIILAGGLGTRLRSVVQDIPKSMASIGEHPFLYYLLRYLERYQIKRVVLALGYKHEIVIDWLGQQRFDMEITWVVEKEPLGTGGAIRKALEKICGDEVLVMNGDTLFDINLQIFYEKYKKSQKSILIALKPMEDFDRYGNVEVNEEDTVVSFHEKAYCRKGCINGGVYFLSTKVNLLEGYGCKFSFETDVLQPKAKEGQIGGYLSDGYFIDIGIPEDYKRANQELGKV